MDRVKVKDAEREGKTEATALIVGMISPVQTLNEIETTRTLLFLKSVKKIKPVEFTATSQGKLKSAFVPAPLLEPYSRPEVPPPTIVDMRPSDVMRRICAGGVWGG